MVGAWFMGLANNAMTDEQRTTLSPDSEEYRLRVGGSKVQVAGWSLYTLLLWLLKTCMAVFYSRLTYVSIHIYLCITDICPISSAGLINMRVRIHIAFGFIAATYIATICSILFGCHPMHKNWQINPDPGSMWLLYLVIGLIPNDCFQIIASPQCQRSTFMSLLS